MRNMINKSTAPILFLILLAFGVVPLPATAAIVADHTRTAEIPAADVNLAKSTLHIAYGHTSHGSQLVTGMSAMMAHDPLYSFSEGGAAGSLDLRDYAMDGDAGYYPDWVNNTRSYLGAPVPATGRGSSHPEINVVIWSWCGQVSGITEQEMTEHYLAPMAQLETEYPGIRFVYMTGHLDGSGTTENLNLRNNQIRQFVLANNKILFDFADIESYDPDGDEFLSRLADDGCYYDGGYEKNWAAEWMLANPSNILSHLANAHLAPDSCAHSNVLNCVLKGRAAWWLWARLASLDSDLVRIQTTSYTTLNSAYGDASNGDIIMSRAVSFTENLLLNRTDIANITLQGGYAPGFSGIIGYTTLDGALQIIEGSLTLDRLIVK